VRVNGGAQGTLYGGLMSFTPGVLARASETFGTLTVKGFGTLYGSQIPTFGGAATMTFGTFSRSDNFSTLYVGGPVFGPGAGNSVQITVGGGIPSPGGSGDTIGIVPWIGGDRGGVGTGAPTGFGETLYTYNNNGLFALDSRGSDNFDQIAAGDTLVDSAHNALSGNPAALAGNVSVLSLVLNPDGTGTSTISGTGTLTVSTGAIANIRALTISGPTLDFGSATAFLFLGNNITISGNSSITGTGGVVVSSNSSNGRNTLTLTNTALPNTFTGGLYLNGSARVLFNTADTQLGAAGQVISFRGGTLRFNGASAVSLVTGGVNRPLVMAAAGGGAIAVENAAGVLTVPGLVSGPDQLTKIGSGTLVLSNPANTYAGGTALNGGTLALGGAGSLGTGDLGIGLDGTGGSILQFNFAGTFARNINVAAAASVNTNTNAVTLSGVVGGAGASLTKVGGGTLTLAGANTYAGNTIVSTNGGTLLVANTTGSGTGFGSVSVLSGAAFGGTGAVGGPVAVASGGTLVVGTGTAPGTLTHHGATTLASGSTFQGVVNSATAGSGYSQLVVQSGGSLDLGSSTLNLTLNYTPGNTDMVFIVNNQTSGLVSNQFSGLGQNAIYTFPNGTTAHISYQGDVFGNTFTGGNDVVLSNFVPVPEPAGLSFVAAGVVGLVTWRRRRK
jgi:autotransporter-associated beta strand protein